MCWDNSPSDLEGNSRATAQAPCISSFVDESSQTGHKYLLLGGLTVQSEVVDDFNAALSSARSPGLQKGEIKWGKVSKTKLEDYKKYSDCIFSFIKSRSVCFHSLVVDTSKVNNYRFNNGSRDIGFNKEIYQLCMKIGKENREIDLHTYLDQRTTSSSLEDLRKILNHGIRKSIGCSISPYKRLHFRDSSECNFLQAVDILLGACAFKLNNHYDSATASPAKKALCDHVLKSARITDITKDTSYGRHDFTIWHRILRK